MEISSISARSAGIGRAACGIKRLVLPSDGNPMTPSRDISRLHRDHGGAAHARHRLPVGPRAEFCDDRALHHRGGLCEVADAIARGDFDDLREELGDLLLQVVSSRPHGGRAKRLCLRRRGRGDHTKDDPPPSACVRRQGRQHIAPAGVKSAWERIKAEERPSARARRPPEETTHKSLLSGVKAGQPALTRAMELQRKASTVGFDWNDPRAVLQQDP